jgi:alpha/beta superfamily hydrolase
VPREVIRERLHLPGNRRRLDAELAYSVSTPRYACLILNPHPHMGGCMANPVVEAVASAVAEDAGVSLRFDYGGVGASQGPPLDVPESMAAFWRTGKAPEDARMLEDAAAALDWFAAAAPLPRILVGYSFGASVAASLEPQCADALVLVSPTLNHHDFGHLGGDERPLLLIYGDDDFATPKAAIDRFIQAMSGRCQPRCVTGGQHFFRGQERTVATLIVEFAAGALTRRERSPCP